MGNFPTLGQSSRHGLGVRVYNRHVIIPIRPVIALISVQICAEFTDLRTVRYSTSSAGNVRILDPSHTGDAHLDADSLQSIFARRFFDAYSRVGYSPRCSTVRRRFSTTTMVLIHRYSHSDRWESPHICRSQHPEVRAHPDRT